MDLKELTEAMHRFVSAQGWYEENSPRAQTLRNLAISLTLEAGEVLEHFQWGDAPADRDALSSELADVMLYLMQLSSLAGIDLEQAVVKKLEKNYQRKWETPAAAVPAPGPAAAPAAPPAAAPAEPAENAVRPAARTTGILQKPRPWPFSRSELTSGLRRATGLGSLTITEVNEQEIPGLRPARGRVRGLRVSADTENGPHTISVVIKEPQGASRAGTASAGWREASLYTLLSDQIPLKVPRLLAAGAEGEWLALELLSAGRPPEQWRPEDYALAVDQLVVLHDRFWGQAEYLNTYPWLARPLSSDLDIYTQAAAAGLQRLLASPASLFHQDPALIQILELLVKQAGVIASALRRSPATLLHGDYWPGNLVLYPDRRLYAIDWQRAGVGPGVLDLFNFIQSGLWWFERLPVEPAKIVQRYREGLEVACGQRWADEDWDSLWDYALMWTFLSDWIDLLSSIPNSILQTRWAQLEGLWIEPLRQAVHRRLVA